MKLRNEIIKEAVRDFYGDSNANVMPIVKYMTKRNKPKLTEEQKNTLWYVRANLKDKDYRDSIIKSLSG